MSDSEKPTEEQPVQQEPVAEQPAAATEEEKKEEETPAPATEEEKPAEEAKKEEPAAAPVEEEKKEEEAAPEEEKKEEEVAPAAEEEKKEEEAPAAATEEEKPAEEAPAAEEEKKEDEPTPAPAEEEKKEEEAAPAPAQEEPAQEEEAAPAPAPANTSGMTREEFIRQMGLTQEDVTDPSRTGVLTDPSTEETAAYREDGQGPQLVEDDVWLRNADLTDTTIVKKEMEEDSQPNQFKTAMLDTFRTNHSHTSAASGDAGDAESPQRNADMPKHSANDHQQFEDYKTQLLSKFRERKELGVNKTPSPVKSSPRREKPAEETSAPAPVAADDEEEK